MGVRPPRLNRGVSQTGVMVNEFGGLSKRTWAVVIDTVILLLFTPLLLWLRTESKQLMMVTILPLSLLNPGYFILFHTLGGQSLGKMTLGLRVELVDGGPLTWARSIVRFSPVIVFQVIWAMGEILAIRSIPESELLAASFIQRTHLIMTHKPGWARLFPKLYCLWIAVDVIVLVSSGRKRAIHDFMAGTVVRCIKAGTGAHGTGAG